MPGLKPWLYLLFLALLTSPGLSFPVCQTTAVRAPSPEVSVRMKWGLEPAVPSDHAGAAQPAGGAGSAHPGSVTQLSACLLLRPVGPLGTAHFFLCKTSPTPHCALPFVRLGLFLGQMLCQGLMAQGACERTTCAQCSPPLPPPTSASPASGCSHVKPRFSPCAGIAATGRGTFPHSLSLGAPS